MKLLHLPRISQGALEYSRSALIAVEHGKGEAGLHENAGGGHGVEGVAIAELAGLCMGLDGHTQTQDIPDDIGAGRADTTQGTYGGPDVVAGVFVGPLGTKGLMVPTERFELSTSPLPRECSTPELCGQGASVTFRCCNGPANCHICPCQGKQDMGPMRS